MTSKGLVLYYSATGNTKAMLRFFEDTDFDIINIRQTRDIDFDKYNPIIIGTSSWGRGIPPKPFFSIRDELVKIEGKQIGLWGSGRTEFEFFCGAIDLLEQLLQDKNKIIFKYKYEGYPKERNFEEFENILKESIK